MTHQCNLKRTTVVCPKCGKDTTFNMPDDAIDEEGEILPVPALRLAVPLQIYFQT